MKINKVSTHNFLVIDKFVRDSFLINEEGTYREIFYEILKEIKEYKEGVFIRDN